MGFIWDREGRTEMALLSKDGTIHLLRRGELDTRPFTQEEIEARAGSLRPRAIQPDAKEAVTWQPGGNQEWDLAQQLNVKASNPDRMSPQALLVRSHLSGQPTEDLMALDAANRQLHVLVEEEVTGTASASGRLPVSLDSNSVAVAALTMPPKINGERDVVLLQEGSVQPTAIVAAALAIDVDRTDDTADVLASACTVAPNDCSLRGAVAFANVNPGGTTINVPAGTYQLTIPGGATEGFSGDNSIGDLDVSGNDTTIMGGGAGSTIIQQTQPNDRVIEHNPSLEPNHVFNLSGVTITGGRETMDVGGGGMISGAEDNSVTVTDCVFSNNQASGSGGGSPMGGGLGHSGGSLTVTNCTFGGINPPGSSQTDTTQANQSQGSGGGLYYSSNPGTGTLMATNSAFTNNVSTSGNAGGLLATIGTSATLGYKQRVAVYSLTWPCTACLIDSSV